MISNDDRSDIPGDGNQLGCMRERELTGDRKARSRQAAEKRPLTCSY